VLLIVKLHKEIVYHFSDMSEKFSPAIRIGDVNDFIAPSQACTVSLKERRLKKPDKVEVLLVT